MKGRPGKILPHTVIVILAVIVYLNSLPNGFIWDDHRTISRNYLIKRISRIPSLFVTDLYEGTGGGTGAYRPLLMTSFAIDFALFGPRPWAFRLVNILLHAGASLLVYLVLRRLVEGSRTAPFLAAGLFAVHPVHTEAVVMVMGRAEPLAACLVLGAWLVYLRRGRWALEISLLLFFLSLFVKETAAIFPFLLAAGALFRAEPLRRTVRDFLLAWGVFIVYVPIRILALGGFVAEQEQILLQGMGLLDRLQVMVPVFGEYVLLALFPVKLSLDYQFLALPGAFSGYDLAFGAIALVGVLALLVETWRGRSPYFLAIFLFLIPLLPVSNLFPMGEVMGERLLYLPSIGVCLALALLGAGRPRTLGWGAILLALLCLGGLTAIRNGVLADQGRVALATLRHYPDSYKAHGDAGEHFRRTGDPDGARRHFESAIRIRPRYRMPKEGLGDILLDEGRIDEAVAHFIGLRREYPRSPEVAHHLGKVLHRIARSGGLATLVSAARLLREGGPSPGLDAGLEAHAAGNEAEALRIFRAIFRAEARGLVRESIRSRGGEPTPRMDLGVMAYLDGDPEGAVKIYREVLAMHPYHVPTLVNLAAALAVLGENEGAVEAMREAIRWGDRSAASWSFLGECKMRLGHLEEALEAFDAALALDPGARAAGINRGSVLLDLGRDAEAEETLRSVRERHPRDADAAFVHARTLEAIGRREEAVGAYRAFLDLYRGAVDSLRAEARERIRELGGGESP